MCSVVHQLNLAVNNFFFFFFTDSLTEPHGPASKVYTTIQTSESVRLVFKMFRS